MLLKENPATQMAWKIGVIYRMHMQNIMRVNEKYGLYPGQSRILHTVSELDGSMQKELADRLGVSPASMAVSIKRMQKAGLLAKSADMNDLRSNRICVTEKGRRIQADSISDFINHDNRLLKGFGPAEIAQLDDYLTRLQVNLKEARNLNDNAQD
jgi:DNA-binding MarR family transcriptional regulator